MTPLLLDQEILEGLNGKARRIWNSHILQTHIYPTISVKNHNKNLSPFELNVKLFMISVSWPLFYCTNYIQKQMDWDLLPVSSWTSWEASCFMPFLQPVWLMLCNINTGTFYTKYFLIFLYLWLSSVSFQWCLRCCWFCLSASKVKDLISAWMFKNEHCLETPPLYQTMGLVLFFLYK